MHQCVSGIPADRLERAMLCGLLERFKLIPPVVRDQSRFERHASQLRRRCNQHRIRSTATANGTEQNAKQPNQLAFTGCCADPVKHSHNSHSQLLDAERMQHGRQAGQRMARRQALLPRIVVGQHDAGLFASRRAAERDLIASRTVVRAFGNQPIAGHRSPHIGQSAVLLIVGVDVAVVRHRCELLVAALMAQPDFASDQMGAHHDGEYGNAGSGKGATRAAVEAVARRHDGRLKRRNDVTPVGVDSCADGNVSYFHFADAERSKS